MGSCSNKASNTKNGIQVILVTKPSVPDIKPSETIEKHQIPPKDPKPQIKVVPYETNKPISPRHAPNLELNTITRNSGKNKNPLALKALLRMKIQEAHTEAVTATITNPIKTPEDTALIEKCLKSHFIFYQLSPSQIIEVVNSMRLFTLDAHQNIFKASEPGSHYFIIGKGRVEVKILNVQVKILESGQSFGEGALLQNVPRSATINTIEPTQLWGLEREEFRRVVAELNAKNFQENMEIVSAASVFKDLTFNQKEALVESVKLNTFLPNAYIIVEGETGELLYIVKSGTAVCFKNGTEICRFTRGDCFGEQALFFKIPRSASVIAVDKVECICVTSENLESVLGSGLEAIIHKNTLRLALKSSQYLKKLSKLQEEVLISNMSSGDFDQGNLIIPAGTPKQADLLIVVKGKLVGKTVSFGALKCIGEAEIIENSLEVWKEDIFADASTSVYFISKTLFEAAIGGTYHESVGNNSKIRLLKNVSLFRTLTIEQYNGIIQALKLSEFDANSTIFEENDPGDSLFIIKSGSVDILKKGIYLRSVGKNDYFGERSILFSSPRTATAVTNSHVVVWILLRSDFLRIISDRMRINMVKRIELQDETIQLNDLKIVKLLGKGLTGIVFLAVHKTKKTQFALKTVHKQKIFDYDMYDSICLERKILLQLDHVFIMKLVKTFKDEKRVYFLTEYVRGMDLFDVIRAMNFISEKNARFFVASLILAVENLHDKEIVYRDLKPENVVVDDEGYLKMIDMGTAKFLKGRTFTVIGTPQYMSPEVITRTGYSYFADYWSIGIMMFEFLFGYLPFGEEDNDPIIVYEKVLARDLKFPKISVGAYTEAIALIEQLLSKNPSIRHGGSSEALKSHPWFRGYDWDRLLARQAEPPYVPPSKNINNEIEAVLGVNQNLDNIISKEENCKYPPDLGKEAGWDKDF